MGSNSGPRASFWEARRPPSPPHEAFPNLLGCFQAQGAESHSIGYREAPNVVPVAKTWDLLPEGTGVYSVSQDVLGPPHSTYTH